VYFTAATIDLRYTDPPLTGCEFSWLYKQWEPNQGDSGCDCQRTNKS